jgi:glycosyltransferase involved in cell wall biosynthesis
MSRPGLAIIANAHTPYRLHLHQRIARELPEIMLYSVYTHQWSNAPWQFEKDDETNPVMFGQGQSSREQSRWRFAVREWNKGGEILRWIQDKNIRALVMLGYNDLGRFRVIHWAAREKLPCFLFGDSNIRGDHAQGMKRWVKQAYVSNVVSNVSGVMPCGRLGAEYFRRYGAKPESTYFFPYEPDYTLFRKATDSERTAAIMEQGWSAARRRFVYSGRLAPEKGVDLLIDAFIGVAADRPEWDLVIVGDGPLREALKARVPQSLQARVQWLGFLGQASEVARLYAGCDVLVLPSLQEPWAVVINEAVSSGLAVVASEAVGAAYELVENGVNGERFATGDRKALEQSLRRVSAPEQLPHLKAGSEGVLRRWRELADPVAGLRRALKDSGVLSS